MLIGAVGGTRDEAGGDLKSPCRAYVVNLLLLHYHIILQEDG